MTEKLLGNLSTGMVYIISGPAGSGKTTLVNMLVREFPNVISSISYTTRPPRPEEVDGVDYFFVTEEQFKSRIAQGEFLEYVRLYDWYYGTSRLWVNDQLNRGKYVILVIDTQGALYLKDKVKAVSIFIAPPSLAELELRLLKRKSDSPESILKRLSIANEEISRKESYDYLVINDNLDVAYKALRSILIAEERRVR